MAWSSPPSRLFWPWLVAGLVWGAPVAAEIVCCDVDGKRTCGDPPPPECTARAKTIYRKGGVAKEIEAPLTAEQRRAREAEEARKREEAKKAAEQARKDRALLDSYSSIHEIDIARDRSLADIEKNTAQLRQRLEAALAKRTKLEQEKEFYLKKPMPAALQKQIDENAADIAALERAIAEKDAAARATRERFEADKQRYLQLTGKAPKP